MGHIVGIYLSGTGNTKHCMEKLLSLIDEDARTIAIEDSAAVAAIETADRIFLGYPTQFSNAPMMVRDFIREHGDLWRGKEVVCIATMGAFSGDGAGCTARLLKGYGAVIVGGIHFRMPDSVCDHKALKKSREKNQQIIAGTDKKITKIADEIRAGRYPREGLGFFSHVAGLLGQRLWFYGKTKHYSDKLKIDTVKCKGCGSCAQVCPMKNIHMDGHTPVPDSRCTMCYRCISLCPQQAITLLGREVVEQCRFERWESSYGKKN